MPIELRVCEREHFPAFFTTTEVAFSEELKPDDVDRLSALVEPERTIAAFDGDVMVGTNAAYAFDITVPGGVVPATGVTLVGVLPTHRRQGVLTRMIRRQLEDARGWNEPVAVLWASEGAIYYRFGYGLAAQHAAINIERNRALFRSAPSGRSKTRIVSQEEALKILPDVYDRVRISTPGMLSRSVVWWEKHRLRDAEHDRDGGGPLFRAVLEAGGRAEGYVLYRAHPSWGDDGNHAGFLDVVEAVATSPEATRDLWEYIFGVDLVERVKSWFLPPDHPLKWMLREPRRLRMNVRDSLWVRIVDVIAALEQRSYAAADRLVFHLQDELCEWNAGTWLLDTTGDNAEMSPVDEAPALRLTAEELGAVYLGGTSFGELAQGGRVQASSPEDIVRADALFATGIHPWCPEIF